MPAKSSKPVIHESPDGGRTVYARQFGSMDRELIWQSKEGQFNRRWAQWRDILLLAEEEPSLNDVLNQAEVLYEILKK